jgi:5-(carboxyamino)imidazole ribonucleotide mutase
MEGAASSAPLEKAVNAKALAPPTAVAHLSVMESAPVVAVVMGSQSDWATMRHAAELLTEFDVPFEARIVSAHRTPDLLAEFARSAEARGLRLIIAGAGGAAHLPGMLAAHTHVPVLGVPVETRVLRGVDSLLSIVQMPAGIPVPTLAIGEPGAKNAALAAVGILALHDGKLREKLVDFRARQTQRILQMNLE